MYGMLTSLENNVNCGGAEDHINGIHDGKVNIISHLWTLGVNVGVFYYKRGVKYTLIFKNILHNIFQL